ncbi:MAG: hypothetical protein ABIX28_17930 [Vicinamibacterales bacterium]
MKTVVLPLAVSDATPVQMSAETYYRIPVAPIYKSYPVYAPGREPSGYFAALQRRAPEIAFDAAVLATDADWVRAGELVFDAPIGFGSLAGPRPVGYERDPRWLQHVRPPIAVDGTIPFYRYVIREQGKVEIGVLSCGMCHTRVMPDGTVIKGAQGNFPAERALADDAGTVDLESIRRRERRQFAAPWLAPDAYPDLDQRSLKDIVSLHEVIPPGVVARHGTSPLVPVKVPDLIGIRDRHYLDATGLMQHRNIGDLMRYAAMNQTTDLLARYGAFIPAGPEARDPVQYFRSRGRGRYSDEQLYALARYIYSLTPPTNPNRSTALTARGQQVFEREECGRCHTPPLYTNNKLTIAKGFVPRPELFRKYDVMQRSVGTDSDLALKTRRGTGFYKVPSLKGVWYRGPFGHSGWAATLEDWFDLRRTLPGYVPTAFTPDGVAPHPVIGHRFGLDLSADDKQSLMAFLRTL